MAVKLDQSALLAELSGDRALASHMLFGHRHTEETPLMHVEIMDLWRAADEFVVIEAFRGGAKTTLSEEFLLLEALFGNFRYCLLFGETYTKACQRIEAMKFELVMNEKLRKLFGDQIGKPWNENQLGLKSGILIEAHGWEEEIRGYKHLDARPDRAHLDDIETLESVRSTAAVDAGWKKLNQQLIPALDKNRRKVRLTGTPLADDTILARAQATDEWVVAKFPVCIAPGAVGNEAIDHPRARSLWPERYPMSWIRKERDRMQNSGLLREMVQEYQLIAAQTQGKPFVEEQIVYEDVAPLTYAPRVYIVDPARTTVAGKSDRTGRVVASRIGTRIYVHESSGEYWKPDAIVSSLFDTSMRHDDAEIAIERNSLDEWLLQPIRTEMLRRRSALDLQAILAPGDRSKEQFILGLQPFFNAGDIILVGGKAKHSQLVNEILNFPSGKRDILNALAYVQRVFGGQAVYPEFSQENIAVNCEAGKTSILALCLHSGPSETCGALVEIAGRHMTVLHEFTSALAAGDALDDIFTLLRAAYPGRIIQTWVAGDLYDQQGRVALTDTLRMMRINPMKGGYLAQSRGVLAEPLRASKGGTRLFRVDSNCSAVKKALAGGYRFKLKSDGRSSGDPEQNVSKTLMESIEVFAQAVISGRVVESLPPGFGTTTNAQGRPFLSALRR